MLEIIEKHIISQQYSLLIKKINSFMKTYLITACNHTISFLKDRKLPTLTEQQKKIAMIASVAFSCLAMSYFLARCLLKPRPLVVDEDVDQTPNPFKPRIDEEAQNKKDEELSIKITQTAEDVVAPEPQNLFSPQKSHMEEAIKKIEAEKEKEYEEEIRKEIEVNITRRKKEVEETKKKKEIEKVRKKIEVQEAQKKREAEQAKKRREIEEERKKLEDQIAKYEKAAEESRKKHEEEAEEAKKKRELETAQKKINAEFTQKKIKTDEAKLLSASQVKSQTEMIHAAEPHLEAKTEEDNSGELLNSYAKILGSHIQILLNSLPTHDPKREKFKSLILFLNAKDHKREIYIYCNLVQHPEYEKGLYQSFAHSYRTLGTLFQDKEFPNEKKIEISLRFEAERDQCVPGRAGLLQDICTSVDEPAEIDQKLPWLIARYKTEIIKFVITEMHYTHFFIAKYGEKLSLLPSVIKAAKADPHILNCSDFLTHLEKYKAACTSAGCLGFLENFINADISGRAEYRNYILKSLASQVSDEQLENEETEKIILAKHKEALAHDIKREWALHLKKYEDQSSAEARASWEKFLKIMKLKENPFYDSNLFANYQYKSNPEDSEDNHLTEEAIQLFAQEALRSLKDKI